MFNLKSIWQLFKKDVLLEIRLQYSFYGIILYILSTIFVLYNTINEPEAKVWNGLFWVVQLFICINAVAKSFLQESPGRMLYYYTIASPVSFMISKLLFNALLMLVMSVLSLLLYSLFLGSPIQKMGLFIFLSLLGGISLSLVFTFLAAIAAKAKQNAAVMAILGFPIIIPQISLLSKISKVTFSPILSLPTTSIALLISLNVLIIFLSVILFPFLWKE